MRGFLLILAILYAVAYYAWGPVKRVAKDKARATVETVKREAMQTLKDKGVRINIRTSRSFDRAVARMTGDVFSRVDAIYPSIMKIIEAPDGHMWVVSKYGVHEFDPENIEKLWTHLTSNEFRERFPNEKFGAFSTAHLAPDGSLWTGGWHGHVMRFHKGRWSLLSGRDKEPKGKIESIVTHDGAVYLSARRRLWRFEPELGTLVRVAVRRGFGGPLAVALDGRLYGASGKQVFVMEDKRAFLFWEGEKADRRIESLWAGPGDVLHVGTHDGFVRLDRNGQLLSRELRGRWITGFAGKAGENFWVSSWKSGIYIRERERWKVYGTGEGLADNDVLALALGPRERVWAGIYGEGLFLAPANAVVERAR